MIRNEKEYQEMIKRLEQDLEFIKQQKELFQEMGLSSEEMERAMAPTLSFHEQLKEEVEYYERIKRGEFEAIKNLVGLGRTLIGIRIALGISQRELAKRLNVSEAQISKDERNEYHGITLEKAQKILDALGATLTSKVEELPERVAV
ncbi:helix-turn-helix domain-containing protein [Phosphitispora fastidiosa]|uniref:helix-turn-helix domain-containing protein n=1 Tax=Phosphitispora fastidiosa TaxID=2837202 RepID=UPI001E5F73A2|nr:helix-turn-helix transcriptional regulator [Phosphitispora fastidiosa]MBU7006433.1 DNA-binding Xre family transcriptional regulator [Phosphitispora fastidiosa]